MSYKPKGPETTLQQKPMPVASSMAHLLETSKYKQSPPSHDKILL
jgi:hypothetical protein